jgi:NADPH:quinone reductase-like Zn-dependent oxidoreductase
MGSMQVARELGASLAISTSSRPDRAERARAAGFGNVIDLSRESLPVGVAQLTGDKGVDVVIDGVAGRSSARPSPAWRRAASTSVSDTPGAPPRRSRSPT